MKERFIKSTFILLIGGLITKILGMVIKIIMGRLMGSEGLGLYMLILPTFSLFISISQLGMPIAVSKMVAEDTKNNKNIFFSILPIILFINLVLIFLIILLAPIISNVLLHNNKTYLGILAIAVVIPFTSISSICRSYFFGKERMLPHVISNILEDVVRLFLMIIGIPYFLNKGIKYAVGYIILSNVVSEFVSILILFLFLPKNIKINKSDIKPNKQYIKEALSIGIPNTTGRLIGSIGYFLEPIILTSTLLLVGYNNSFITREYGVLSGYVMPLVLLPSFFTLAISQALLPVISKEYSRGKYTSTKKKLKLAIGISLLIGIPITIFFMIKPGLLLNIIYKTNEGVKYVKFLAPICLFQYIQAPLSSCLDAMGKAKDSMIAIGIGTIVRTILIFVLSLLKIGIWGLIISISINVLIVTFYEMKKVKFYLK